MLEPVGFRRDRGDRRKEDIALSPQGSSHSYAR
jgi:hypothetical protein